MAEMKKLVIDGTEYELQDAGARERLTTAEGKISTLQTGKANSTDVPSKVSDLENDTGFLAEVPVEGVTIDGESIVQDKTAVIPRASATKAGAVKVDSSTAAGTQYVDIYAGEKNRVPLLDANNKILPAQMPAATTSTQGALDPGDKSKLNGLDAELAKKVDKEEGKGLSTLDYTVAEQDKLAGIAAGAEVNQNAFSNVKIGSTTVAADGKTDTLELAGSNVTLTPDATNDKVTIGITKANVTGALGYTPPTTNTTYNPATTSTAGLMSAADKAKLNDIFSLVYPVGAIYMSVNSVSPATIFGGTWEPIENRFLLAAGSAHEAGSTGGEETHKLTVAEMPSHTHAQNSHYHAGLRSGSTSGSLVKGGSNYCASGSRSGVGSNDAATSTIYTNAATASNQNTGGGGAHNNMPPYLTVYMWKRTA